ADADVRASQEVGYVNVEVHFRGIPAIEQVVLEKLIAAPAAGHRVAVVHAIKCNGAETPVDVIGLDRVRITLQLEYELIEFAAVRDSPVGCVNSVIAGGAPVSGRIAPAAEGDSAVLDALRPVGVAAINGLHDGILTGIGRRNADQRIALVFAVGKGRRIP